MVHARKCIVSSILHGSLQYDFFSELEELAKLSQVEKNSIQLELKKRLASYKKGTARDPTAKWKLAKLWALTREVVQQKIQLAQKSTQKIEAKQTCDVTESLKEPTLTEEELIAKKKAETLALLEKMSVNLLSKNTGDAAKETVTSTTKDSASTHTPITGTGTTGMTTYGGAGPSAVGALNYPSAGPSADGVSSSWTPEPYPPGTMSYPDTGLSAPLVANKGAYGPMPYPSPDVSVVETPPVNQTENTESGGDTQSTTSEPEPCPPGTMSYPDTGPSAPLVANKGAYGPMPYPSPDISAVETPPVNQTENTVCDGGDTQSTTSAELTNVQDYSDEEISRIQMYMKRNADQPLSYSKVKGKFQLGFQHNCIWIVIKVVPRHIINFVNNAMTDEVST